MLGSSNSIKTKRKRQLSNLKKINFNNDGGTCFLSPHSDDISMSGLFIIKDNILPNPYYLFTVFSDSNNVGYLKRDIYSSATVQGVRIKEDETFCKKLGIEFIFLMEPCCKKRLGHVIFDPIHDLDVVLTNEIFFKIYAEIKNLNIKNLVVQYPYGDKQHYDHRIVKAAAMRLSDCYGYNVFFLDDIPYSSVLLNDFQLVLYEKKITGKLLDYKHEMMDIYDSQMSEMYHSYITANNTERLFTEECLLK